VSEGLSPTEAGKALAEHADHEEYEREKQRDRTISIVEACLLAIVAVLAAYSGWTAAKWSTESSLALAQASIEQSEANAANVDALNSLNFDVTAFNAWFTAYVAGNREAMAVAAKRFTPNFRVAFEAWLATNPKTNPNAPPGPTYMPQYKRPEAARAVTLNGLASTEYTKGQKASSTSDNYIRTTIYLATVLFLAGLGSHFGYRLIRYGLASLGVVILGIAIAILATSPRPP
jgi:hypothetical protein